MRTLALGVFGFLLGVGLSATDAPVVVHLIAAPDAGDARQMSRTGFFDLWIAQPSGNSLARPNLDGTITEIPLPDGGSSPLAISRDANSDGRIVFTETGTNRIGVIGTSGGLVEYDIPTSASNPRGVAGTTTVWFTEYGGNQIGQLQPGSVPPIVEYPLATPGAGPLGIAFGPGAASGTGAVWFTEYLLSRIGRIDGIGTIDEFFTPTADSRPGAIVAGLDGGQEVMFFTEENGNRIGKASRTGSITEYTVPTDASAPVDLAYDPAESAVWFAERAVGQLGWMSGGGDFRELALPTGSKPESVALETGLGPFAPSSVWFLDATNLQVGRVSDNHIFAVGAGHLGPRNTQFELTNDDSRQRLARIGRGKVDGSCQGSCPPTTVDIEVGPHDTAEIAASAVPSSDGLHLFYVTGIRPDVSDVPPTRAWIVDASRPQFRLELPLVNYWTVAGLLPPQTGTAPASFLKFPARRRAGWKTDLLLATIESNDSQSLLLRVQALSTSGQVISSKDFSIAPAELLDLDDVLARLAIVDDFEGEIRVTRLTRSGLFWGVAEIYENGNLSLLMPPGSELAPPDDCTGGPAECGPRRQTRVVNRVAP